MWSLHFINRALIRFSRASDFLNRAQLLTQKLHKQGYVAHKSSLQKLYDRQHGLFSNSQMSVDLFPVMYIFFFSLPTTRLLPDLTIRLVSCKIKQKLLTVRKQLGSLLVFFGGVRVVNLFSCLCGIFVLFVDLPSVPSRHRHLFHSKNICPLLFLT